MEGVDERGALVEDAPGSGHLEGHQGPQRPRGRRPGRELIGIDSEAVHVLGGQVDAAGRGVLGNVLPVLGELQPGADPVRPRQPLRCRRREGGQHQPSDGVGRQPAIVGEVFEGGVAGNHLILAVGRDQIRERGAVRARGEHRGGRTGDERVQSGLLRVGPRHLDLAFQPVQGGQPVALIVVADLVDQPGESVEGQQVLAGRWREQPRGDPKVFPAGATEDLVRVRQARGRDLERPEAE